MGENGDGRITQAGRAKSNDQMYNETKSMAIHINYLICQMKLDVFKHRSNSAKIIQPNLNGPQAQLDHSVEVIRSLQRCN